MTEKRFEGHTPGPDADRWLDSMREEIEVGTYEYGNGENACADMQAVLDRLSTLLRQREELREALDRLVRSVDLCSGSCGRDGSLSVARSALAKLDEGEEGT